MSILYMHMVVLVMADMVSMAMAVPGMLDLGKGGFFGFEGLFIRLVGDFALIFSPASCR
mgnify:FL=1